VGIGVINAPGLVANRPFNKDIDELVQR
jgi:hypothetical protein